MNGHIVLDTNALINHFQGFKPWTDFLNDLSPEQALVSVITRMELLAWPGLTFDEEKKARSFLDLLVKVVPLSNPVEEEAILLRRKARLKLPDAIVTATAVVFNAVLLTNDKAITTLNWPNLKIINPT